MITVFFISAACGGNVGLCMGLSLLSVVEFIYFFTLRIIFDRINNNKDQLERSKSVQKNRRIEIEPNDIYG